MSADAKLWTDGEERDWLAWKGLHDGPCSCQIPHDQGDTLAHLIRDIETCMGGRPMRWVLHVYPDGKAGLRGFTW